LLSDRSLALIAARACNGVIGKDGALPWHLPGELKYFKQLTLGHAIIMGRKTWDSLGRPLPGRRNIVVTRDNAFTAEGAEVAHTFVAALSLAHASDPEPFVIGGAEIYAQALPYASKIYMTEVHADFEGDTYFPELNPTEWHPVSERPGKAANDEDPYMPAFSYCVLERRS